MTGTARQRFAGRGALVTGAGGEIGAAVARALVGEGAKVTLVDRAMSAVAALAAELGPRAHAVAADVTVESEVKRAVAEASDFGDGLRCVFNNAGIEGPVGPIEDLDLERLRQVLEVNVLGAAAVLKHSLCRLSAGGVVVQTGSTASLAGSPHMGPYVTSKHALLGLTRVASREATARGVRVSAVCPGPVDGRMMDRINSGRPKPDTPAPANATTVDGGRYASVDEVVATVLFLLSEDARFVSGSALLVDGGRMA